MIQVGRLGQADVDAAAGILFDAFGAAYRRRGHAPPFPTRESAAWLCRAYIDLDPEGCALARSSSEVVGVGFAHPRGARHQHRTAGVAARRAGGRRARADGRARRDRCRLDQRAVVPGQLQSRLVRSVHAARLRGDGRRPLSARGEARAADRLRPQGPAAGRRGSAGHRTLRSVAHRGRPAPRPHAARIDGRRLRLPGGGGAAKASPGICSFVRCPRASSSGPAVAESAEMLAALVDGVAASLPGRAAVIRASAAAPLMLRRAFDRGFLRRSSGEPDGARFVHSASGTALRAVSRELVTLPRPRCHGDMHRGIFFALRSGRPAAIWVGSWTFAAIAVRPNTSSKTIASPSTVRPCSARPAGTRSSCRAASRSARRRRAPTTGDGGACLGADDRGRQDPSVPRSDDAAEVDRRAARGPERSRHARPAPPPAGSATWTSCGRSSTWWTRRIARRLRAWRARRSPRRRSG